jgi:hypothetical protein
MLQLTAIRALGASARLGICVAWALCLTGVILPAGASSIKARTQSERLLREILPCTATLAVNVDAAGPGSSFASYSIVHQQRMLRARDSQPAGDRVAELVMGMIATEVQLAGNVDAWNPNGEFERLFTNAVALQLKDGKSPTGVARVEECVAMGKRLAPSFDIADLAAVQFGFYPASTPKAPLLIDTSESLARSASRAAKDDAKRNVEEFAATKGYLTRCRFAEDDDFYATRPFRAEKVTTPLAATRPQMEALAAEGRHVFVPCTYAGTQRSRYQPVLGQGAYAFLSLLPAAAVQLDVPGLTNAVAANCHTSVSHQTREEVSQRVNVYEYTTSCGPKTLEDVTASTELKGVGEVVLLASPDAAPMRAAQRQRMHCALYVRDLDYVARQLPAFLAAVGGWGSLQDYFAQQSLWKAENYVKTSGNASVLQQRANAKELIGQGRATKNWSRKISDEVFFPAPHFGQNKPPPPAGNVPDSITSVLTQVLGTGPTIWRDVGDPHVQTTACLPRKKSLSEKYVRLLQTKKEEKEVSDKIWGSDERAGAYGFEGPDNAGLLHCYRFDDTVDPLVCASYYPQLWAAVERLPMTKRVAVGGEDIY